MSGENTKNTAQPAEELSEILRVRREKLAELREAGRDPFELTRFERTAWSKEITDDFAAFEDKRVAVAGRIMSKRGMGKAIFCHIKDDRGQLQIYVRSDAVSGLSTKRFKLDGRTDEINSSIAENRRDSKKSNAIPSFTAEAS